jgi:hypothetical protein
MAEAYPGEWHQLSPKDKKRLHDYATQCAQGKLLYEAERILECAIKNWTAFRYAAEAEQSAFNTPAKPNIDFLIRYLPTAVNKYLNENNLEYVNFNVRPEETPTLKCIDPPKPAPTIPAPTLMKSEPFYKPTWAELMADPEDEGDNELPRKPPSIYDEPPCTLEEMLAILNEDD